MGSPEILRYAYYCKGNLDIKAFYLKWSFSDAVLTFVDEPNKAYMADVERTK